MGFNLSAWSLRNRQIVVFVMLLIAVVGALSYSKLGQSEDPPFTFKAMVITTHWPGATAEEVSRQITERIEKKLMETGEYDRIVSFSRPGESTVTFMANDALRSRDIPDLWYQIRKKIGDIRHTLPAGTLGPFFNDEFGTTFGNIYALTGKGFDYAVLKDYADRLQLQLQRVQSVGKVELVGLQDEKIWIELSNVKLATLGVPLESVRQALQAQNSVAAAGFVETLSDRVQLRVTGSFQTLKEIRDFPIRVDGQTFRIGDVAKVYRGFNDPPAPRMRFMGEPAIGLAVSMKSGGDILLLGEALQHEFARLQQELPAGM
ncbi:AcrB/AcrD/AcrF family protein, partial [Stutzerimonas nosocomialis]